MITAFIPTFNSERTLKKTIQSIKSQTYPVKRIIIIDSGSTDNTYKIAEEEAVEFYSPEYFGFKFLGLGKARNRILELFDTEFLLSVDSDVILEKTYIEKMLPLFNLEKKIAGVGAKQIELNRVDLGDRCRATIDMRDLIIPLKLQKSEFRDFLLGSNNIYKTEILYEIGEKETGSKFRPFKEGLTTNYEDAELGLKIKKYGYKLFWTPEVLTFHLQKDNLLSFIDRAYRYRFFKWDLKGAFKDYNIYYGKIDHNVNYTLMGINIALEKNRENLIFPMILACFYFFLKDCFKFIEYEDLESAGKIYNSILEGLNLFEKHIREEIFKTFEKLFIKIEKNVVKKKLKDTYIINRIKELSEIKKVIIPEEKLSKKNVLINFTDDKVYSKDEYVINYFYEHYNEDELYFELKCLKPKQINIKGKTPEHLNKILRSYNDVTIQN